MCLDAIEKKLTTQLLDFQKYGVAFAIRNGGRCMIADDMGLGSLGIYSFIPFIILIKIVCYNAFVTIFHFDRQNVSSNSRSWFLQRWLATFGCDNRNITWYMATSH